MKRSSHILTLLLMAIPVMAASQIQIDQGDMPVEGDTLRVSTTVIVPVDWTLTGSDTTWDFSMLEPMNQRVDTFVSVYQTPQEYWLFFVWNGAANLASPKGNGEFFPDFPVTGFYTFYKSTANEFVDAGFALNIQGFPLPARYDVPDKYYTFPLDTASVWESASSVSFQFPDLFYFSTLRNRSSFVDGWGTVITPFGSFECLRIRSDLVQSDSIYVDSLGFGLGLNRSITEYKWLSKNMGIPVLQISSEGPVVTATYRDSTRMSVQPFSVSLGPDTTVNKGDPVTLHAFVSGGTPPFHFFWSTLDTGQTITVALDSTQGIGVLAIDGLNVFASDMKVVTVISPGLEERTRQGALLIHPNPTHGKARIQAGGASTQGVLTVYNACGVVVLTHESTGRKPILDLDLSHCPSGIYLVRLQNGDGSWVGKTVVER